LCLAGADDRVCAAVSAGAAGGNAADTGNGGTDTAGIATVSTMSTKGDTVEAAGVLANVETETLSTARYDIQFGVGKQSNHRMINHNYNFLRKNTF